MFQKLNVLHHGTAVPNTRITGDIFFSLSTRQCKKINANFYVYLFLSFHLGCEFCKLQIYIFAW